MCQFNAIKLLEIACAVNNQSSTADPTEMAVNVHSIFGSAANMN